MQYELPQEEEGCFVFEVVNNEISARSQPNILTEDKTRLEFEIGELVSIDLIQHSLDKNNGPYLRLTDRSGWLFASCMGQERMRRVPVERGIWPVYVDNFPNGQYLRRHPVVSPDLDFEVDGENVLYEPGTKLYCDAKVVHPISNIAFYRVQGTRGWIFDHKPSTNGGPALSMLLDVNHVRTGFFCYQAVQDIVIRLKPSTEDDFMTREVIKAGEIVSVDFIRENVDENKEDGPFLRLTDGMGWLFAKKHGIIMMKNVPVSSGSWILKILNAPVGVGLRRHPIVCQDKLYPVVYPTGSMVQCDQKVSAVDGTNFFHVTGTRGWLFDRRGSTNFVVELILADENTTLSMHSPWEPNFVRGVAATVEEISEKEQPIDDQKGVLTFERKGVGSLVIHVYCKSRTVVVYQDEENQICEQDCTTKKLVNLFNYDATAMTENALEISQDETMPTGKNSRTPAAEASPDQKETSLPRPLEISESEVLHNIGDVGVEIVDSFSCDAPDSFSCDEPISHSESHPDEVEDTGKQESEVHQVDETEQKKDTLVLDLITSDPTEIALRNELLKLEESERETREKRVQILTRLKRFDDERGTEASMAKELSENRLREMKAKEQKECLVEDKKMADIDHAPDDSVRLLLANIPEDTDPANVSYLGKVKIPSPVNAISPRSQTSSKSRRSTKSSRSSRSRNHYQCGECDEIFSDPDDREDHCREVHGIVCEVCDKAFKSFRVLDLHKDRNDHW